MKIGENYGMMLAIMRRFCKECRAEGKHRLHTMNGDDCATCCVPGVITRAMTEQSITMADDEEREFFAKVALKQIEVELEEANKEARKTKIRLLLKKIKVADKDEQLEIIKELKDIQEEK